MVVTEGVILIAVPAPAGTPPHEEEYHCQEAPVPRLPTVTVKVVAVAEQIDNDGVPVTKVGIVESALTTTETVQQFVVLQAPSALT